MERGFLGVCTLIFAAFGAYTLIAPEVATARIGFNPTTPLALYELRGVYGGISLAIAGLCGWAIVREDLRRPALIFLTTYMCGYLFARVVGVFFDGPPRPYFYTYIVFEAVVAIVATALLRRRAGS